MRQENIDKLKNIFGDRVDDDALAVIEVINDDEEIRETEWEKKYNDLDAAWRKKYADAFNGKDVEKFADTKTEEEKEIEKEEERVKNLKLSNFGY